MPLERRSASQVCTLAPQRPGYSLSVLAGGTAPSGASWATGFAGYPFLVAGNYGTIVGYDAAVAADSPAAWWKLADNAGSSQAYDSSGNGHAGTAANVKFGNSNQAVTGDSSAAFSATSPVSSITTSYNPALSAVTVECWVNLNGAYQITNPRFMANSHTDYSDYDGFELWLNAVTNYASVTFGNGSARTTVQAPAGIPGTGWTHLAATWNGTTITLYINGASVGTGSLSGSMPAGTASGIGLGWNPAYSGDSLTGLLAECAIYSSALSAARIAVHYNAGIGNLTAQQPAQIGDKFQLYTGTSLKQPDVFTVAGLTPSTGYSSWNIFFGPQPLASPAAGDMAVNIPRPSQPKWLGAIGHVSKVTYSFACPGGPDQMSCLLQLPPDFRTDAINPGRVVQVWRGANCVWEGKLDEPTPGTDGWQLSAHGAGQYGGDFTAVWTAWNADNPINAAISRGLRWSNPGIGTPSGIYLGQQVDSGSDTISSFLSLICNGGALLWLLTPPGASSNPAGPWVLSVFTQPADVNGRLQVSPNRILVSSSPVPRTIAADINTIVMRYQATADIAATSTKAAIPATYSIATAVQADSVTAHGPMEYYLDLSSAGVMTAGDAQQIGTSILNKYVRAAWSGTFSVGPGQLMTQAGVPVDLGCEKAGTVIQLMVTDAPYGGEIAAAPLVFMVGGYSFDDDTDTATVTPMQAYFTDMASLIGALYPGKFS